MGSSENRNSKLDAGQSLSTSLFSVRLGWRVLIPGLTQMTWRQRERGMVYLVRFLTSLGTSLFCWGSLLGWCFLAFLFPDPHCGFSGRGAPACFSGPPSQRRPGCGDSGDGLDRLCSQLAPCRGSVRFRHVPTGRPARLSGEPSGLSGEGTIARTLHLDAVVAGVKPEGRPSDCRRGTGSRMDGSTLAGRCQGPPVETSRGAALLPECLAVPGAAEPRCHRARDHQRDYRT